MSKTFKEYEKEYTIICPNCHIQIKTNLIPMSIFDNIHEDMYISHEDEYLERKALQQRIDKALELLDSYKLGKYDYALTPAGLLELEDILKGKTLQDYYDEEFSVEDDNY